MNKQEHQKQRSESSSIVIVPKTTQSSLDALDEIDMERYRNEAYLVYGIDDPERFGSRDVVEGVVGRHIAMRRLQAKGGLTLYEMAMHAAKMSSDYLMAGCSQQEWANRVRPFGCGYAQYRKLVQLAQVIEEGYLTDREKTFRNASATVIFDALPLFGYARSLMKSGESESARLFAAFVERFLQSSYATQENLTALRQAGIVEKWPAIFKSIKESLKGELQNSARGFFDAIFPGMDGDDELPTDDSPFVRFIAGLSTGGLNGLSDVETATTSLIAAGNAARRRRAVRNANDDDVSDDASVVRLSWNDNPYAVEDRPKAIVEMTTDDGSYCTITIVNAPVSILSILSQFVRLVDSENRRIDVNPF